MNSRDDNGLAVATYADKPRVLALTDQYPNLLHPQWAPFNRQQLAALAGLCRLALVAPVPWPMVLSSGRLSLPPQKQPFETEWPVFWYLPRVLRRLHGKAFFYSAWPALRRLNLVLRPTVFLATWLFPAGWAGLMAARRLGLPLVIKLHGSGPHAAQGRSHPPALFAPGPGRGLRRGGGEPAPGRRGRPPWGPSECGWCPTA